MSMFIKSGRFIHANHSIEKVEKGRVRTEAIKA